MTSLLEERRLIMRVYAIWQTLAGTGLPSRDGFDPACLGADWNHCLMIKLDPMLMRSRFVHVGDVLRMASGFEGAVVSDCAQGSLIDLVTRRLPQVVLKKTPIGFGGSIAQGAGDLLYRTVLLPFADGETIDTVVGAIAFRLVPIVPETPISDIAWCNRVIADREHV